MLPPERCPIDAFHRGLHHKDLAFFAWQRMGKSCNDGQVVLCLWRGSVHLVYGMLLNPEQCSLNILNLLEVHVDSGT